MYRTLRNPGTNRNGSRFDVGTITAVWQKAAVIRGNDPDNFRKDACGAWIRWSAYGNTGEYGWEIDHRKPVAAGGGDELTNLQPLHWRNNREKGDLWPARTADYCAVTARS